MTQDMAWLGAVGAVANPLAAIVDSFTGTGIAKAEAAEEAAKAKRAQYEAQIEAARLEAANDEKTMQYGLWAVGLLVCGVVAYKALS